MNDLSLKKDRYVSFCGLDCDQRATDFMRRINQHLETKNGATPWIDYFTHKLNEKAKMGVDDLFFIGAQMNTLNEYLEQIEDEEGLELLWYLEQECC
ncbi:N(2)-fixation sustaining protein CowN [Marinobacterium mangrovicola]|uniref:N(2)-fixation sustaining protein CowN n=1 Tax=Marinobacterium mangrovicola TaxID=1476959 RepID=A0A4R1G6F4_9GAMM|nr:N(2)-fixation sustaining protein CowN [Marinobacterium mangrovicola]TCK03607.1 hypothetical protein CLV83_3881 [Marinobacterium mangrovicola]